MPRMNGDRTPTDDGQADPRGARERSAMTLLTP